MKWATVAIVSALDVALAAVLSLSDDRPDRVFLFLMVLAILWILPLLTGLWSLVKFWATYHLFLKRRLIRYFKAKMHESKFPASAGHFDHMAYLSHILDEDYEEKAKMKAAYFVGQLATYRETQPFTMGVACQSAFEAAMEEYRP